VTAQPTVLHVPSLAAAVTGDLAYNQVHMMTAETVDPNGLSVLVGAISIARAVDDPDLSRHTPLSLAAPVARWLSADLQHS
jgi:hypothetical protein